MQTFGLYIVSFTHQPFAENPKRKIAEGVIFHSGQCAISFLNGLPQQPAIYASLSRLESVFCSNGSKFVLLLDQVPQALSA